MMNKRGSVLAHVLVTTIVVAVIAAGLAQMVIQRYTITAKATEGVAGRKQTEGSLARVVSAWSQSNLVCENNVPGFTCSGTCNTNTCNPGCTMTPTAPCVCDPPPLSNPGKCPPAVVAQWDAVLSRCQLTITTCP